MGQFNDFSAPDKSIASGLRLFSPEQPVSELTPSAPQPEASLQRKKNTRGIGQANRKLWLHPTGRWCIRVAGKAYYFGKDKKAAEIEWERVKDDVLAGRNPDPLPEPEGEYTLGDLCNLYLAEKLERLEKRELSPRTFKDCKTVTDRLIEVFGKSRLAATIKIPDFAKLRSVIAKGKKGEGVGALALSIEIQRTKAVFAWGSENEILEHEPKYGTAFDKPARKMIRAEAQPSENKMLQPAEIKSLLAAATPAMKAMILLAVNTGMGNTDLAMLPISAIDLKTGWIDFPRPKTAVPRRCFMWKETVAAVKEYMKDRPAPRAAEDADLLFVTKFGASWCRYTDTTKPAKNPDEKVNPSGYWSDSIGQEFNKLLTSLELKKKGRNFYALRHVFSTIADESLDTAAIDLIMGHAPENDDMRANYRRYISDERLKKVAMRVRKWLFAKNKKG